MGESGPKSNEADSAVEDALEEVSTGEEEDVTSLEDGSLLLSGLLSGKLEDSSGRTSPDSFNSPVESWIPGVTSKGCQPSPGV